MRRHNFYPGPSALPIEVLQNTQQAVLEYQDSGVGILELSHRSEAFLELLHSTEQLLRQLLAIPEPYEVVFTTGGATQQFSMVPMNLLTAEQTADYLITGSWAQKAYIEAQKFAAVQQAASGEDSNFCRIPQQLQCSKNARYLHYTSNNTIYGTQFHQLPTSGERLVCDASSDLLSRTIDVSQHALIYAAAQKNFGPSGITVVILERELLNTIPDGLPVMLDYRTYTKKKSLYNTPPTFAIFVVNQMLNWISKQGGLDKLGANNQKKAKLIYDVIDQSEFYRGFASEEDRSSMNVTYALEPVGLLDSFLAEAQQLGFLGLQGHRSVGGLRASLYNGVPGESVTALAEFMQEFAQKNG